jgi:hypothetical protein
MSCSNVTCLSAKVWGQYNETNSKFADIIDARFFHAQREGTLGTPGIDLKAGPDAKRASNVLQRIS